MLIHVRVCFDRKLVNILIKHFYLYNNLTFILSDLAVIGQNHPEKTNREFNDENFTYLIKLLFYLFLVLGILGF